ncbi:hypothetical protein K438DRAFT_1976200 [Mycena galopus ATCC 62051]|nr:hypothetical protein K438DRAFT_1976200 [Mycena galopus ATCC 62051]
MSAEPATGDGSEEKGSAARQQCKSGTSLGERNERGGLGEGFDGRPGGDCVLACALDSEPCRPREKSRTKLASSSSEYVGVVAAADAAEKVCDLETPETPATATAILSRLRPRPIPTAEDRRALLEQQKKRRLRTGSTPTTPSAPATPASIVESPSSPSKHVSHHLAGLLFSPRELEFSLTLSSLTPSPVGTALAPAAVIIPPLSSLPPLPPLRASSPTALRPPSPRLPPRVLSPTLPALPLSRASSPTALPTPPATPSPVPARNPRPQNLIFDDVFEMAMMRRFTGNFKIDKITAENFLREVRMCFRRSNITLEDDKFAEMADRFVDESAADVWFRALVPPQSDDWEEFEEAFTARFRPRRTTSKPGDQLMAEATGMRIDMSVLAAPQEGREEGRSTPFGEFVDALRELVTQGGGGDERGGVYIFFEALPPVIQEAIGAIPRTWNRLLAALDSILDATIASAVREYHKDEERRVLRGEVDAIARKMKTTSLGGGGGGSAPRVTPPVVPVPPQAPAGAPQLPAGGAQAPAGGARGGRRGPIKVPTEAEKAALRLVLAATLARRAPDTPDGHAQYTTQVTAWNTRNGHLAIDRVNVETTSYPLFPGTAPPCSGECWRCGRLTNPTRHDVCPAPPVPEMERRFRAVCGTWLGRSATNAVNLVEEEEGGRPWWNDEAGDF